HSAGDPARLVHRQAGQRRMPDIAFGHAQHELAQLRIDVVVLRRCGNGSLCVHALSSCGATLAPQVRTGPRGQVADSRGRATRPHARARVVAPRAGLGWDRTGALDATGMKHSQDYPLRARPMIGLEDEYLPGFVDPRHSHAHAQFLYASSGVMSVVTPTTSFVIPPQRALWLPAGMMHEVSCRGAVSL